VHSTCVGSLGVIQPTLETGHMIFKLGKDVLVSDVCICVMADDGEG
jgi:hypothetical protein